MLRWNQKPERCETRSGRHLTQDLDLIGHVLCDRLVHALPTLHGRPLAGGVCYLTRLGNIAGRGGRGGLLKQAGLCECTTALADT